MKVIDNYLLNEPEDAVNGDKLWRNCYETGVNWSAGGALCLAGSVAGIELGVEGSEWAAAFGAMFTYAGVSLALLGADNLNEAANK